METMDESSNCALLDLYDDLITDEGEKKEQDLQQLEEKYKEALERICSLEKELQQCHSNEIAMKSKADTLEKNITNLFVTARAELQRKDKELANLRRKLASPSLFKPLLHRPNIRQRIDSDTCDSDGVSTEIQRQKENESEYDKTLRYRKSDSERQDFGHNKDSSDRQYSRKRKSSRETKNDVGTKKYKYDRLESGDHHLDVDENYNDKKRMDDYKSRRECRAGSVIPRRMERAGSVLPHKQETAKRLLERSKRDLRRKPGDLKLLHKKTNDKLLSSSTSDNIDIESDKENEKKKRLEIEFCESKRHSRQDTKESSRFSEERSHTPDERTLKIQSPSIKRLKDMEYRTTEEKTHRRSPHKNVDTRYSRRDSRSPHRYDLDDRKYRSSSRDKPSRYKRRSTSRSRKYASDDRGRRPRKDSSDSRKLDKERAHSRNQDRCLSKELNSKGYKERKSRSPKTLQKEETVVCDNYLEDLPETEKRQSYRSTSKSPVRYSRSVDDDNMKNDQKLAHRSVSPHDKGSSGQDNRKRSITPTKHWDITEKPDNNTKESLPAADTDILVSKDLNSFKKRNSTSPEIQFSNKSTEKEACSFKREHISCSSTDSESENKINESNTYERSKKTFKSPETINKRSIDRSKSPVKTTGKSDKHKWRETSGSPRRITKSECRSRKKSTSPMYDENMSQKQMERNDNNDKKHTEKGENAIKSKCNKFKSEDIKIIVQVKTHENTVETGEQMHDSKSIETSTKSSSRNKIKEKNDNNSTLDEWDATNYRNCSDYQNETSHNIRKGEKDEKLKDSNGLNKNKLERYSHSKSLERSSKKNGNHKDKMDDSYTASYESNDSESETSPKLKSHVTSVVVGTIKTKDVNKDSTRGEQLKGRKTKKSTRGATKKETKYNDPDKIELKKKHRKKSGEKSDKKSDKSQKRKKSKLSNLQKDRDALLKEIEMLGDSKSDDSDNMNNKEDDGLLELGETINNRELNINVKQFNDISRQTSLGETINNQNVRPLTRQTSLEESRNDEDMSPNKRQTSLEKSSSDEDMLSDTKRTTLGEMIDNREVSPISGKTLLGEIRNELDVRQTSLRGTGSDQDLSEITTQTTLQEIRHDHAVHSVTKQTSLEETKKEKTLPTITNINIHESKKPKKDKEKKRKSKNKKLESNIQKTNANECLNVQDAFTTTQISPGTEIEDLQENQANEIQVSQENPKGDILNSKEYPLKDVQEIQENDILSTSKTQEDMIQNESDVSQNDIKSEGKVHGKNEILTKEIHALEANEKNDTHTIPKSYQHFNDLNETEDNQNKPKPIIYEHYDKSDSTEVINVTDENEIVMNDIEINTDDKLNSSSNENEMEVKNDNVKTNDQVEMIVTNSEQCGMEISDINDHDDNFVTESKNIDYQDNNLMIKCTKANPTERPKHIIEIKSDEENVKNEENNILPNLNDNEIKHLDNENQNYNDIPKILDACVINPDKDDEIEEGEITSDSEEETKVTGETEEKQYKSKSNTTESGKRSVKSHSTRRHERKRSNSVRDKDTAEKTHHKRSSELKSESKDKDDKSTSSKSKYDRDETKMHRLSHSKTASHSKSKKIDDKLKQDKHHVTTHRSHQEKDTCKKEEKVAKISKRRDSKDDRSDRYKDELRDKRHHSEEEHLDTSDVRKGKHDLLEFTKHSHFTRTVQRNDNEEHKNIDRSQRLGKSNEIRSVSLQDRESRRDISDRQNKDSIKLKDRESQRLGKSIEIRSVSLQHKESRKRDISDKRNKDSMKLRDGDKPKNKSNEIHKEKIELSKSNIPNSESHIEVKGQMLTNTECHIENKSYERNSECHIEDTQVTCSEENKSILKTAETDMKTDIDQQADAKMLGLKEQKTNSEYCELETLATSDMETNSDKYSDPEIIATSDFKMNNDKHSNTEMLVRTNKEFDQCSDIEMSTKRKKHKDKSKHFESKVSTTRDRQTDNSKHSESKVSTTRDRQTDNSKHSESKVSTTRDRQTDNSKHSESKVSTTRDRQTDNSKHSESKASTTRDRQTDNSKHSESKVSTTRDRQTDNSKHSESKVSTTRDRQADNSEHLDTKNFNIEQSEYSTTNVKTEDRKENDNSNDRNKQPFLEDPKSVHSKIRHHTIEVPTSESSTNIRLDSYNVTTKTLLEKHENQEKQTISSEGILCDGTAHSKDYEHGPKTFSERSQVKVHTNKDQQKVQRDSDNSDIEIDIMNVDSDDDLLTVTDISDQTQTCARIRGFYYHNCNTVTSSATPSPDFAEETSVQNTSLSTNDSTESEQNESVSKSENSCSESGSSSDHEYNSNTSFDNEMKVEESCDHEMKVGKPKRIDRRVISVTESMKTYRSDDFSVSDQTFEINTGTNKPTELSTCKINESVDKTFSEPLYNLTGGMNSTSNRKRHESDSLSDRMRHKSDSKKQQTRDRQENETEKSEIDQKTQSNETVESAKNVSKAGSTAAENYPQGLKSGYKIPKLRKDNELSTEKDKWGKSLQKYFSEKDTKSRRYSGSHIEKMSWKTTDDNHDKRTHDVHHIFDKKSVRKDSEKQDKCRYNEDKDNENTKSYGPISQDMWRDRPRQKDESDRNKNKDDNHDRYMEGDRKKYKDDKQDRYLEGKRSRHDEPLSRKRHKSRSLDDKARKSD